MFWIYLGPAIWRAHFKNDTDEAIKADEIEDSYSTILKKAKKAEWEHQEK